MQPTDPSIHVDTLLALLLVASATAVIIKWVRIPYAVALVIAGLIIGLSGTMPPVHMTPELVLLIFLPALLFEASWNLDIKALQRDWLAISALATVGVVVCMFSTAAILSICGGLTMATALLFGAMVAATDPVSVIALFRKLGVDKRLTMILEGESLFNDGTAVVLFKLVLAAVIAGAHFSAGGTILSFVVVVLGGALLGATLGYVASRITSAFEDHLLEITLTMVTAYGSYLAAEQMHVSSVIAVVAAGIVLGNYGSRTGMSATTRLAVNSFWEYAAFFGNSLLFLLIGLQVKIGLMVHYSHQIALGVVAVFAARLVVVYGICPFISTKRLPIPDNWRHLMFWGGLRGALVMALALSLPTNFPDREAIINMTFGVVLFTLLVPGLTIEPLVKFLGMAPKKERLNTYQEYVALLAVYRSELQTINQLKDESKLSAVAHDTWKASLHDKILDVSQKIEALHLSDASIEQFQDQQARITALEARKSFISGLSKSGGLTQESAHRLHVDVDAELDEVISREPDEPKPRIEINLDQEKLS